MPSPPTDPSPSESRAPGVPYAIGGKYFALAVLFGMNLLNYVDRYSFFAVATHVKKDLHISNEQYGYLSASFMIVYTVVTPLVP